MNAVLKIFYRGLVIEFYRQNAAFFGLVLLVFFGFIRAGEHLAIGAFLVNNPEALLVLYGIWALYVLKVILFLNPLIRKPENSFLHAFTQLPTGIRFMTLFTTSLWFLAPVLAYGAFLVFLAVSSGLWYPILSILICLMIFASGLSLVIYQLLLGLPYEKQVFQFRWFKKYAIPPWLFFISYLVRKETVLLLLTKAYCCLLIIGTTALYRTDSFDWRVLATGLLLAEVGNVAIMHKFVWFQYQPMAFTLNLPVSFTSIILRQLAGIAIIVAPELLVLARHYPLSPQVLDVAGFTLFTIGLVYFLYAWMILKQVELGNVMVVVFWLVVILTFLILFSIHPLIMGIILLVFSVIIVYFRHYRYEHTD